MPREDLEAAMRRLSHFTEWGWSSGELVEDIRTLLEAAKTASENVTIDVPGQGPGGVTQRYTVSGVVVVDPADAVRIEAVTSHSPGRVDVPSELILTTSGTVRIATDQPFTLETIPPMRGAVREYR